MTIAVLCLHWGNDRARLAAESPPRVDNTLPLILPWEKVEPLKAIAFSAGGKRIVTALDGHIAIVWDAKTGREIATLTDPGAAEATSIAISGDGRYVAIGCDSGAIDVWETQSRKKQRTLVWHFSAVTALTFRNHGAELLSASADKSLVLWDLATGLKRQLLNTVSPIVGAALCPDERRAATDEDDGTVVLWDLPRGKRIQTHQGKPSAKPKADPATSAADPWHPGNFVAFSLDGKRLAAAAPDKSVTIWNVETGEAIHRLDENEEVANCIAFSADGKQLITTLYGSKVYDPQADNPSEALNHSAVIWNAVTGKNVRTVKLPGLTPVGITPDGASIAVVRCGYIPGDRQELQLFGSNSAPKGIEQ